VRPAFALCAIGALAGAGCGSDDEPQIPPGCSSALPSKPPGSGTGMMSTMSMTDPAIRSMLLEDLFVVDAVINARSHAALAVDTGAPITAVRPSPPDIVSGVQTVNTLQVGTHVFNSLQVVGEDIAAGTAIEGVLGCTAICQTEVSFNYRDKEVTFGNPAIPSGVEDPAHEISFCRSGGLDLPMIQEPASRILVYAKIEGVRRVLLVDTGAFAIAMRTQVFSDIVSSDGRKTLPLTSVTATGQANTKLVRLHSVSINGVDVQGAIGASADAFDTLLSSVSSEVGLTVDGTIGAPYLHEFFVSIDYPNGKLSLRRYANRDHIVDLMTRVGFFTGQPTTSAVPVEAVVSGSDADRQGVKQGDLVTAIDGRAAISIAAEDSLRALSGAVGSSHAIEFACSTCSGGKVVKTIKVEDLLAF
jgi:aspartyl protease